MAVVGVGAVAVCPANSRTENSRKTALAVAQAAQGAEVRMLAQVRAAVEFEPAAAEEVVVLAEPSGEGGPASAVSV